MHDELCAEDAMVVEHAHSKDDLVIMSSRNQASRLHLLRIEQMNVSHVKLWEAKGEVTCLSVFSILNDYYIATGSITDGTIWLTIYSLNGKEVTGKALEADLGTFKGLHLFLLIHANGL